MARHSVFPCKHADYALRCARTDTFQGSPLIFIMQVLFYPTAIGSEPQDPTLNSYPHWTRVMCGHAGANLVRHSSLSRNKSVTCRCVTRLHPLYMQQYRFSFACASKVCRGNFVLCWADKVIGAQRISIRAKKNICSLLVLNMRRCLVAQLGNFTCVPKHIHLVRAQRSDCRLCPSAAKQLMHDACK